MMKKNKKYDISFSPNSDGIVLVNSANRAVTFKIKHLLLEGGIEQFKQYVLEINIQMINICIYHILKNSTTLTNSLLKKIISQPELYIQIER